MKLPTGKPGRVSSRHLSLFYGLKNKDLSLSALVKLLQCILTLDSDPKSLIPLKFNIICTL